MRIEIIGEKQKPTSELFLIHHREGRSLLDFSRLTRTIGRGAELVLALGTVTAAGIAEKISKRPAHIALALATGTLALGVLASAFIDCNIISAQRNIAAITTSQAQSSAK